MNNLSEYYTVIVPGLPENDRYNITLEEANTLRENYVGAGFRGVEVTSSEIGFEILGFGEGLYTDASDE